MANRTSVILVQFSASEDFAASRTLHEMAIQTQQRVSKQWLTQPGWHWVLVGLALYIAACLLPAMKAPFAGETILGWRCLTVWIMPWWWANPSILLAIILYHFRCSRTSAFFGVVAVGLAVHCELSFLHDDGDIQIGCVLWVSSIQIITINSLWQAWLDRKQRLERLSLLASQDPPAASPHS